MNTITADTPLMDNKRQQQVITDPHDKVLYQRIVLFAMNSLKSRHGFTAEDCLHYLTLKGLNTNISTVTQALRLMTMTGIVDQYYSVERNIVIYRLH